MLDSKKLVEDEEALAGLTININGSGPVFWEGKISTYRGSLYPRRDERNVTQPDVREVPVAEFREAAIAARRRAAALIEAADHMDSMLAQLGSKA